MNPVCGKHLDKIFGGSQYRSGRNGEKKILALPGIEIRYSSSYGNGINIKLTVATDLNPIGHKRDAYADTEETDDVIQENSTPKCGQQNIEGMRTSGLMRIRRKL